MDSKRQSVMAGVLVVLIAILYVAFMGGYFRSDEPFTGNYPVDELLQPWQKELERQLDEAEPAVQSSLAKLPAMELLQIQFPTGNDVRRYQDNCRQYFEFRKVEIETYQRQTSDPAELQQLVIDLLTKYHRCAADLQEYDDALTDLQTLAQRVSDLKTDHPIAKFYAARLQADLKPEDHQALIQKTSQEVLSGSQPLITRLEARSSLLNCAKKSGDADLVPLVSQYLEVLVEWMESLPETSHESRFLWRWLIGLWDDAPSDMEHLQILERLVKSRRPDPWLIHLFAGRYYESIGWKARGVGWASQVSETGWKQLGNSLHRAGRHYAYAWHLRPDFPEPASHMISVVVGANEDRFGSTSQWFQRSINAEIDYGWAYRQFQWSLFPRWGGSTQEMWTFGEKCLDSGRFDTSAPQFLLHGFYRLQLEELGQSQSVMDVPGARPLLEKYLAAFWREVGEQPANDGSIEQLPSNVPLLRTKLAALCVKAGLYQEARRVLEGLPESNRWLPRAFGDCWESHSLGVAAAYASVEDDGLVRSVMHQVRQGFDPRTTPAEFQSLIDQLLSRESQSQHPQAKRFFEQALVIARRAQAFEAGEWVPLTFDHDLAGWRVVADEFQVIDKDRIRLLDHRRAKIVQLDLLNHFQPPYVVDATFEHRDRQIQLADIGVIIGPRDLVSEASQSVIRLFRLHGSMNSVSVVGMQEAGLGIVGPITPAPQHQLRVKVWSEAYSVYVDGAQVLTQVDNNFHPSAWLGIGNGNKISAAGVSNGEVELSHVRIRKLDYGSPPILQANDHASYASNLVEHHARELKFDPDDVWATFGLGVATLTQESQNETALKQIQAALERCPSLLQYQAALFIGYGYQGQRKFPEAAEWLRRQQQLAPDSPQLLQTLAIFLACCPDERLRNGAEALPLAERACRVNNGNDWNAQWARAAALAELTRFNEAVAAINEAVRLAPNTEHDQLQKRRSEFQQRKPYRF